MTDREKVIKGLVCCQYSSKSHCEECPYAYKGLVEINECTADLACDVLSLLKEQEQPKSVYDPRLCNNSPKAYKGFCPWCNSVITLIHGKFCDKCGKAVKWE